jgi:hypothetical protein
MANGYFIDSLEKLKDPILSNRWRCNFNFSEVDILKQYSSLNSQLTLTVKDVDFPGVKTVTDSIFFFGLEKKLPTSADNAGTMTMTIQETEDLVGHRSLVRWHQEVMNSGAYSEATYNTEDMKFTSNDFLQNFGLNDLRPIKNTTSAQSTVNSNVLNIELYEYQSGKVIAQVRFLNLFPVEISPVKLAQDSKELFKYNVSFSYDAVRFVYSAIPTSNVNMLSKRS